MSIDTYTLSNSHGASMDVIPLGAAITALRIPDRDGNVADVVLGCGNPESYRENPCYFGVVVGRYANRIAGARFQIAGTDVQLAQNQGNNHLHGGPRGFHCRMWTVDKMEDANSASSITLTYASPDGEEGYPGNLMAEVKYRLTEDNELVIQYSATSDKPTVINLTQHSYFNLAGHERGNILDHELRVLADRYTPVLANQIPTGEILRVDNSPLDLRKPRRIGDVISQESEQLAFGGGLDHNFVLNSIHSNETKLVAEVIEPTSHRKMRVYTDQPGMQVYSGNFIDAKTPGKNGAVYGPHQGLCLETQHFPDSPNNLHFPATLLKPGEKFSSRTIYQFLND